MVKTEMLQIPKEEYDSMKETIEILSDNKLIKEIKEGIDDIKNGRFISFEDFKKKNHMS